MPRQNFDQGLTVVSCCIIRVYISSVLISKNQNPKKKKKKNHKTRRWDGIMNPLKENWGNNIILKEESLFIYGK